MCPVIFQKRREKSLFLVSFFFHRKFSWSVIGEPINTALYLSKAIQLNYSKCCVVVAILATPVWYKNYKTVQYLQYFKYTFGRMQKRWYTFRHNVCASYPLLLFASLFTALALCMLPFQLYLRSFPQNKVLNSKRLFLSLTMRNVPQW